MRSSASHGGGIGVLTIGYQLPALTRRPAPVRILLVDDHPVIHTAVATILGDLACDGLHFALTAQDGFRFFRQHRPDVTIIDMNLPDASGLELTERIKEVDADAKIVCFSMSADAAMASRAMQCGAMAFVGKTDDPALLRESVLKAAAGESWLPERLRQDVAFLRIRGGEREPDFSLRELEILRCLSRGHSLGEIGHELGLSYKTVTNVVANLRKKLNARTQPEMIRIAMEMKLLG